jgi:hypothetical protein
MTNAEKLHAIQNILDGKPAPTPLPETMESKLRAMAADWVENPTHRLYGETVLDVLDGR